MQKAILLLISLSLLIFACGEENTREEEIFSDTFTEEDAIQKGNVLFNTNCKVCHSLDPKAPTSLAPVIDSIQYHWPNRSVLAKFIKNAPAQMQENERSRKLYQEWKNKAQMPAFIGLSPEEIGCIIEFLYSKS